jgi:hypothetical protein
VDRKQLIENLAKVIYLAAGESYDPYGNVTRAMKDWSFLDEEDREKYRKYAKEVVTYLDYLGGLRI